jgi:hypothetical protein
MVEILTTILLLVVFESLALSHFLSRSKHNDLDKEFPCKTLI